MNVLKIFHQLSKHCWFIERSRILSRSLSVREVGHYVLGDLRDNSRWHLLDILLKLKLMICFSLPLFCEFNPLFEGSWILIYESDSQPIHKLQQSILNHSHIKLSRRLVIIQELNIHPLVLALMVNWRLPMRSWFPLIFLQPLFWLKVFIPTVIILEVFWSLSWLRLTLDSFFVLVELVIHVEYRSFLESRCLDASIHSIIESIRIPGWSSDFDGLFFIQLIDPVSVGFLATFL